MWLYTSLTNWLQLIQIILFLPMIEGSSIKSVQYLQTKTSRYQQFYPNVSLLTFSIKDTTMLEKQGNAGTRGFKTIRNAALICTSQS